MNGELLNFPSWIRRSSVTDGRLAAEHALAISLAERAGREKELGLEEPELLLSLCKTLRSSLDTAPRVVRDEAEYFYRFLEKPKRRIGTFDEREYFLGELAMIAGTACRLLFHRDQARRWLDRAEASFVLAQSSGANIARLSYQRLALAIEERRFEEVFEFAPVWAMNLRTLGLPEDGLKCRFLEALALRETGDLVGSAQVFETICKEAEGIHSAKLAAQALNNLAQVHRVSGQLSEALASAQRALPLLRALNDRVGLTKLRWCVGDVLREQGKALEAIVAYREALGEAGEVGLRGDVAAIHLVIADLLLDVGQDRKAEWEIRAALPIIEEEKMVPEGMAALTLLRGSLRRRQINRQALRELHGYFQESG